MSLLRLVVAGLAGLGWITLGDPANPVSSPAVSPDAVAAAKRLQVAPGLQLRLWAGEPLVQNITSVSYDSRGRAYVVESGRRRTSVFDVRNLGPWLEDDFSFRTETDRADFLHRVLTPTNAAYPAFLEAVNKGGKGGFQDFNRDGVIDSRDLEVESERIRRVTDRDADGLADEAETFADGFNGITSGVAAGVLAEGTNVWFTCIPDLWKLPVSDEWRVTSDRASPPRNVEPRHPSLATRHPLLTGFGVHIAFGGHDLHGLIKGPDGRIYFTIADRGTCVTNREGKVISLPDTGAVFRCEPDGSNFEVFAQGLRNPQELAFDALGNLWTADNNGDGGDKARWTLVLEGADYGWTLGWQWLPKMGAWNSERLWHTRESNTAAYLVPPVALIGHGPAGIAYYPGTGLGDRFKDHFFYADFPGGVRHFRVEPDGAFFKVGQAASLSVGSGNVAGADSWKWLEDNSAANMTGKLLWELSPVDVTFPPFGGLIVADWVQGWEKTGKGRLWHVTDPALAADPQIAEVRRLLAEGMGKRREKELLALLGHRDQRVRLEAQWELAGRGPKSFDGLKKVAFDSRNQLARLHAIWGVGQLVRGDRNRDFVSELTEMQRLLSDREPLIRAQAARLIGGARLLSAQTTLRGLFGDSDRRVVVAALFAYRDLFSSFNRTPQSPSLFGRSWHEETLRRLPDVVRRKLPQPVTPGWVCWPQDELLLLLGGLTETDTPVVTTAAQLLAKMSAGPEGAKRLPFLNNHAPLINSSNSITRLSVLLAARLLAYPDVGVFLGDSHPRLVLEAARAINDVPIPEAMPALAALLRPGALDQVQWPEKDGSSPPSPRPSPPGRGGNAPGAADSNSPTPLSAPRDSGKTDAQSSRAALVGAATVQSASPSPRGEGRGEGGLASSRSDSLNFTRDEWRTWVLRRAVNAAFRLGGETNATALAEFAARADAPESVRVEALEDLADWAQPPKRDKIVGLHRPLPAREPQSARTALAAVWLRLVAGEVPTAVLVATLKAGSALAVPDLAETAAAVSGHRDETVQAELARIREATGTATVDDLLARLGEGTIGSQQAAFARLGSQPDPKAAESLATWVAKLTAGQVVPELQTDLLDAAQKTAQALAGTASAGQLSAVLSAWTNALPTDDPLAPYRVALAGGAAAVGRKLLAERADWGCQRCHKLNGEGGDVGPDLTGLGRAKGREYVLRAIISPNAEIAAGYETVLLEKKDDTTVVGVLRGETADELVLMTAETGRVVVKKSDLKSRTGVQSAMPEGLGDLMTRRDLRDVIEALSQ